MADWRPAAVAAWLILALSLAAIAHGFLVMPPGHLGTDADQYIGATRVWLAGGPFYPVGQLSGPYPVMGPDGPAVLYPPVAIWLIAPFTVLPLPLWWIVPVGVTGALVASWRPRPAAVLAMGLCLAWPYSRETVWWGNPVMWAAAATAAGLRWGWPGPFALLKPSLLPFALAGARRRSWWLGLAALGLLCLPFGWEMWRDWLASVAYAEDGGLLYSLPQVPLMLVPVVAWLGRSDRRPPAVLLSGTTVTTQWPSHGPARSLAASCGGWAGRRRSR
jgi:hypothetical protein